VTADIPITANEKFSVDRIEISVGMAVGFQRAATTLTIAATIGVITTTATMLQAPNPENASAQQTIPPTSNPADFRTASTL
jgi:hypothetical protein